MPVRAIGKSISCNERAAGDHAVNAKCPSIQQHRSRRKRVSEWRERRNCLGPGLGRGNAVRLRCHGPHEEHLQLGSGNQWARPFRAGGRAFHYAYGDERKSLFWHCKQRGRIRTVAVSGAARRTSAYENDHGLRRPCKMRRRKICLTCSGSDPAWLEETGSLSYHRYSQLHIPRMALTMSQGSPSMSLPCSWPLRTSSTNRLL